MMKNAIMTFVQALNASWTAIHDLELVTGQEGLLADWTQATWEAVVEASVAFGSQRTRLVVYGDGADIYSGSSRFSSPNDLPTHQVRCKPVNGMVVDHLSGEPIPEVEGGYALDRFVSLSGNWYHEHPSFDHALVERDGHEYVVALDRLEWDLVETTKSASTV